MFRGVWVVESKCTPNDLYKSRQHPIGGIWERLTIAKIDRHGFTRLQTCTIRHTVIERMKNTLLNIDVKELQDKNWLLYDCFIHE